METIANITLTDSFEFGDHFHAVFMTSLTNEETFIQDLFKKI